MIFTPGHTEEILAGRKTQTRRVCKPGEWRATPAPDGVAMFSGRIKWEVGKTYAVQPGRGKTAVARIRITDIRQERLQDIDWHDLEAEGYEVAYDPTTVDCGSVAFEFARSQYSEVWDRINTRKGTRWQDAPLVWVLTFEVVR